MHVEAALYRNKEGWESRFSFLCYVDTWLISCTDALLLRNETHDRTSRLQLLTQTRPFDSHGGCFSLILSVSSFIEETLTQTLARSRHILLPQLRFGAVAKRQKPPSILFLEGLTCIFRALCLWCEQYELRSSLICAHVSAAVHPALLLPKPVTVRTENLQFSNSQSEKAKKWHRNGLLGSEVASYCGGGLSRKPCNSIVTMSCQNSTAVVWKLKTVPLQEISAS